MKLNNKGLSLIELLLSIVLIGIVLAFLFKLLIDLRGETNNNNFIYNNQVNRTESIYYIQKDLNNYDLLRVEDASTSNISLNFYYLYRSENYDDVLVKKAMLNISNKGNKYYLNYQDAEGNKHSWEMKDADVDPCANFKYYTTSNSNNYYFKFNIKLYNKTYNEYNNKDNNNLIDDIEITYSDYKSNLDLTKNYLTGNNVIDKNIGNCS